MKPDQYGHCVNCHKNLLVPRVVGGKQIMTFTPGFDQTEFIISNKSRMIVCMCKTCKENVDLSDISVHERIMESVKLGWDGEMGDSRRGPDDYKDLGILFHSENIDDYVVQNRLVELENKNESN